MSESAAAPGAGAAALAAIGDGRRLRRAQNRETVIDAVRDLFRAGNYRPSCLEIAARAGLSERSLFRYFDDVDDMHRAAAGREIMLAVPLMVPAAKPDDPTPVKIERLAHSRATAFEQAGPAALAIRANAQVQAKLADEMDRHRDFLRVKLSELFARELAARGTAVLPAIELLCSHRSWDRLRHGQGLSIEIATTSLIAALSALLTGPADA